MEPIVSTSEAKALDVTPSDHSRNLPDDEPRLIKQACSGDVAAQAVLIEHYWDRVYRWLYQMTHDRHLAEDLTQDTFLKVLGAIARYTPQSAFIAWLFRIAHNSLANHWRSRARVRDSLPEDLPGSDNPVENASTRELQDAIKEAVDKLPEDLRAALLLRVEQGLSFKEIAEACELTEETARWRVFKARQKLLAALPSLQESEKS